MSLLEECCREFGKKAADLNVVIVSEEMTFKAQRLWDQNK